MESGPIASGPKDHSLEGSSLMDANIGDPRVVDSLCPLQGVNGLSLQPLPDCGSLELTLFMSTQMFPNIMFDETRYIEFLPRRSACSE